MITLEMEHLKAGLYNVTLAKTAGKVVIDDISKIPAALKTVEIVETPDKAAIKAAMKQGSVEGAHLEEGYSIRIK